MIARFKYRKITPERLAWMKEMRELGLSYTEIAKEIGINTKTAAYHLDPDQKHKTIKRTTEYNEKMTAKERKEKRKKHYPYLKNYFKQRYHNDEDFRKRYISLVNNWQKRKKEEWKSKGLCSHCGGKRKDKQFVQCENCRIKGWKK